MKRIETGDDTGSARKKFLVVASAAGIGALAAVIIQNQPKHNALPPPPKDNTTEMGRVATALAERYSCEIFSVRDLRRVPISVANPEEDDTRIRVKISETEAGKKVRIENQGNPLVDTTSGPGLRALTRLAGRLPLSPLQDVGLVDGSDALGTYSLETGSGPDHTGISGWFPLHPPKGEDAKPGVIDVYLSAPGSVQGKEGTKDNYDGVVGCGELKVDSATNEWETDHSVSGSSLPAQVKRQQQSNSSY